VPKEEDENKEEAIVKKRRKDAETEVSAFGTYASDGGEKFVYREKKSGSAYGGYKIITQKIDKASSREELLDMRTKKKSDRYKINSNNLIIFLIILWTGIAIN
jgi:hypothetical protein